AGPHRRARLGGPVSRDDERERVYFHSLAGHAVMTRSYHCGRFAPRPLTRREMLWRCAGGFGGVALAALLGSDASSAEANIDAAKSPFAPRPTHFEPKATSVIFLY